MNKTIMAAVILAGFSLNTHAAEVPSNCEEITSGSHRLYGPDYVLLNVSNRFELHTAFSYFGVSARFHNDDGGFRAKDDIDISGRAHVGLKFEELPGEHDVWVQWGTFSPTSNCYSKKVVVQSRGPIAQVGSKSAGPVLHASVQNTSIDEHSKNSLEGNGLADIRFRFENTDITHVEYSAISNNESVTFKPQYRGVYDIYAIISDGTFSKELFIGSALYTGSSSCQTCGPLN